MDKRTIFVAYSNRRNSYFEGTIFGGFCTWTKNLQDAFWFLSKDKATKFIQKHEQEKYEIRECVAIYPNGRAAYIREKTQSLQPL